MWRKALDLTGNAPFLVNPVNLSLRKSASLTKKRLFEETFDSLRTVWTADDSRTSGISYPVLNPPKGNKFVNYHSPVQTGKDAIIAVKTSLSEPPSFVMIRPLQKREKIPSRVIQPLFHILRNGKLVWVGLIPTQDGQTGNGRK
jgi:hypothetical protein